MEEERGILEANQYTKGQPSLLGGEIKNYLYDSPARAGRYPVTDERKPNQAGRLCSNGLLREKKRVGALNPDVRKH